MNVHDGDAGIRKVSQRTREVQRMARPAPVDVGRIALQGRPHVRVEHLDLERRREQNGETLDVYAVSPRRRRKCADEEHAIRALGHAWVAYPFRATAKPLANRNAGAFTGLNVLGLTF
jgi:hypothetical protein